MDRQGGIMSYRSGVVKTGNTRFYLPELPSAWSGPKQRLKQLVYENDAAEATIVVDALCGPKYDEAPLPRLAHDMFGKFRKPVIASEGYRSLDGRDAYHVRGRGTLDGVPIAMESVVMKKDFCLYDFVYFAPPARFRAGIKDFEDFLNGFRTKIPQR